MEPDDTYLNSVPGGMADSATPRVIERQMKNVPPPANWKPTDEQFFLPAGDHGYTTPNPDFLRQHFFMEGKITEDQALWLLQSVTDLMSREPNIVAVESPVTICGDIHGQYYDLMKLFEIGGRFEQTSYLFLGDYVDRGSFGIECLLYLYSLKLWAPGRITLMRGNHECQHLTEYFTFKRECLHKYSERVYNACLMSFNALPLAALVDGKFFCVHGGISPFLNTLDDILALNRFQEPPPDGLMCDLLWSDPVQNFGHEDEGPNPLPPHTNFLHNDVRGCSFYYTYRAACIFLERNGLLGIMRGHEVQAAGYTMMRKTETRRHGKAGFPSVITIFSAPNYLDLYKNRGAVLKYADKNITIRQYNSQPHPFWLPNFMDAFTWSLPFVGAKITEMLLAVLAVCSEEELEETSEDEDAEAKARAEISQRRAQIKAKILAVGRMQRVFQLLREEAEKATELELSSAEAGELAPEARKPSIDQLATGNQLRIHNFDEARRLDIANERLPAMRPAASLQRSATLGSLSDVSPPDAAPPSIRTPLRRDSEGDDVRQVLKRRVAEGENGRDLHQLADKLGGKQRPLRRFETA